MSQPLDADAAALLRAAPLRVGISTQGPVRPGGGARRVRRSEGRGGRTRKPPAGAGGRTRSATGLRLRGGRAAARDEPGRQRRPSSRWCCSRATRPTCRCGPSRPSRASGLPIRTGSFTSGRPLGSLRRRLGPGPVPVQRRRTTCRPRTRAGPPRRASDLRRSAPLASPVEATRSGSRWTATRWCSAPSPTSSSSREGLEAFLRHETENATRPMAGGPVREPPEEALAPAPHPHGRGRREQGAHRHRDGPQRARARAGRPHACAPGARRRTRRTSSDRAAEGRRSSPRSARTSSSTTRRSTCSARPASWRPASSPARIGPTSLSFRPLEAPGDGPRPPSSIRRTDATARAGRCGTRAATRNGHPFAPSSPRSPGSCQAADLTGSVRTWILTLGQTARAMGRRCRWWVR